MQFLTDIDNYLSSDIQPAWYKYTVDCSGIVPPIDDRPIVSTVEFINDISECLKNNKYPTYYKYTSCSGVITPDMLELAGRPDVTAPIVLGVPTDDLIPVDDVIPVDDAIPVNIIPKEYQSTYDHETKSSTDNKQDNKQNASLPYLLDKVEYSIYSNNSKKDKIYNMIKRVYRHNDDKYSQACKYILSKFSRDSTDPIVDLNKLLDEKNIYYAIEFKYNPILRLIHVKNIDTILTVDDMYKIFSLLY